MNQNPDKRDLLFSALQALLPGGSGEAEQTQDLKYVIYARKSTDSVEKQEFSLPDQILKCKEHAERNNLTVIDIISESESAKEPGIRPKFTKMLEDIQKGKYQGIISWHPNRLSRNMKEAGEIIDLLDKQIIKSLQFCEFKFENNASGKMLLGIFFVLSKQYSDQLSTVVRRGNELRFKEGKWLSRPKHGYYKDVNQFLRPDGENFQRIKKAWYMRIDKKGYEEIADYLNKSGYQKAGRYADEHKDFKWNKQRFSELFKDPIYAGLAVFGNQIEDLGKLYDFIPMITAEDFMEINKISDLKKAFESKFSVSKEDKKAQFLNGMVVCGDCSEPYSAGLTTKETDDGKVNYFYFRCNTPGCQMKDKSIRGHIVADFVYDFLETHTFTSEEAYQEYVEDTKELNRKKLKDLDSALRGARIQRSQTEKKIENTKGLLRDETDDIVKQIFKGDLKKFTQDVLDLDEQIKKLSEELEKHKEGILTQKEFLELFKDFGLFLRDIELIEEKDYFFRKIFSNFTIKDKKVASYSLNKPFDALLKCEEVLNGRGYRARTCGLLVPNQTRYQLR